MHEDEEGLIEAVSADVIHDQDRSAVDMQVATAHKYPRNVTKAINNAKSIVILSEKIAQTCSYALPRGGKVISGPSVHLAKILAQNWGNLRIEAQVTSIEDKHINCQAVCWDIENNLAIKVTIKRKITDNKGNRFNDDMITMTGNAGNAIALRNAILNVIPRGVVDEVYTAAQGRITGDVSDKNKLIARVNQVFQKIKDEFAVTEKEILTSIGKATMAVVTADDIVVLSGAVQAILDGDTTVDEQFRPEWAKSKAKGDAASAATEQLLNKKKPQ